MAENVDITLLAKLCQDTLAETKAIRRELAAFQQLAIKSLDVLGRIERRNEAHFNAVDHSFAALDNRFVARDDRSAALDARLTAIDSRFVAVDGRLRGIDLRISDLKDDLQLMFKNTETRFIAVERKMVNIEERIGALKDDLELMIKSELSPRQLRNQDVGANRGAAGQQGLVLPPSLPK